MFALALIALSAQTLKVGPGQSYTTIESAVAAAQPGDTIEVYPQPGGYHRTAVRITTAHIKVIGNSDSPVLIDGEGFDYSGVGKIPRAIFQINPGADGVSIRNFELTGAHNRSYNGAGVRINGADLAIIDHCDIHDNDMGIMSAETGASGPARLQVITECHIHHNGAAKDPGFNHNLYLGGFSVLIQHCEIDHSITGHNLKSRAAFTYVRNSYIHDAANREVDLVEDPGRKDPTGEGNFYNCVIAKDPACTGNRGVLHFGAEKGRQPGVLRLVCCTIVTPFASPVILLSDPEASAELDYSIVLNTSERHSALFQAIGGSELLRGKSNWLSVGYSLEGTRVDLAPRFGGTSVGDTLGIVPPLFTPHGLPKPDESFLKTHPGGPFGGIQVGYSANAIGARWTPLIL